MWMHKEAGQIEAFSAPVRVNLLNSVVIVPPWGTVDPVNDTVTFTIDSNNKRKVILKVKPEIGFENITYKIAIYNNGILVTEGTGVGIQDFIFDPVNDGTYVTDFYVQSVGDFEFTTEVILRFKILTPYSSGDKTTATPVQTLLGLVTMSNVMPKIKVKDFLTSIIKMFNLVLVPVNSTTFTLIPLDDWYAKGRLIDISDFVETDDIVVKRPKLFKQIDFKHQKTGQILGERFRENNGDVGYGDLRTTGFESE